MSAPTPTRIEDYLASLPKEPLHYQPNGGNGGDALIAMGTYQAFQRVGIDYRLIKPGDDLTGKVVIYPGGGNLVPYYGDAANFLREFYPRVKRLIIMPHTIAGHEDLVSSFGENVDILCRDLHSLEYVRSLNTRCNTLLAEDMAFSMDLDEVLAGAFRPRFPDPYIDRTGIRYQYQFHRKSFRYRLKCSRQIADFRRLLRSRRERPEQEDKGGPRRVLNCLREDREQSGAPIPWDNIDVSEVFKTQYGRLAEFSAAQASRYLLRFLSSFDELNTNRLHIAIAGALLGKQVNVRANNYFKVRAIYDLSLKDRYPNVRWVD